MAKISVIVPVYNVERYLKRCIESILVQSFSDFRLILVNDGSTDGSGEICDYYKEKDSRITVVHQENQGLSMARNKGIEISSEKYINFIDSDDAVHKDMLRVLYKNLTKYKADISICSYKPVYQGEKLKKSRSVNKVRLLNNKEAVNKILEKSETRMIIAWGKLYKRSLFGNIRYPKGKYHEDEFVTYKLLYDSKRVVVTKAQLYYYTQRKESITGETYSLKRLEKLEGLKEAIIFFGQHGEGALETKAKVRYLKNIQIAYYRIKYEICNEIFVMKRLKIDYNQQYRRLMKENSRLSLIQKLDLSLFYFFADQYCRLVYVIMQCK